MKDIQYFFFDLDGTLTDPGEGITNSVAFALKKFGIEKNDKAQLYSFIGPPLIDSFVKYYNFSQEQSKKAVEYYREYYSEKGIFENVLYDGIPFLLKKLKSDGKTIVLATSKPDKFAEQILNHFGISDYFSFIAGATMDETRTKKDEVIKYALESLSITDTSNVIMVGDRKYDIDGAKKFGIKTVAVGYGYGSEEELTNSKPDFFAGTVEQLTELLL